MPVLPQGPSPAVLAAVPLTSLNLALDPHTHLFLNPGVMGLLPS